MARKVSEDKIQKALVKYGLEDLSDVRDREAVQQIAQNLLGTGLMDAGIRLQAFAKPTDKLQVFYQRALIEQNWVIIRQLDRIAKALEK